MAPQSSNCVVQTEDYFSAKTEGGPSKVMNDHAEFQAFELGGQCFGPPPTASRNFVDKLSGSFLPSHVTVDASFFHQPYPAGVSSVENSKSSCWISEGMRQHHEDRAPATLSESVRYLLTEMEIDILQMTANVCGTQLSQIPLSSAISVIFP